MPARIVLSVVKGPLQGSKYRFDERMLCILGRADNCTLRIPDEASDGISRHHCLLDINPPYASLQDMGSKFGTFLNGVNIGKTAEEPDRQLDAHMLNDGDQFRVGKLVFDVAAIAAEKCAVCGADMPEQPLPPPGRRAKQLVCMKCADARPRAAAPSAKTIRFAKCSVCGADVSGQTRGGRGDCICAKCRADSALVTRIIETSKLESPGSNLLSIKGYSVIKQLGRGGMGAVYLARPQGSEELVALKMMLPQVAVDEQLRADFLREAENTKRLKHPNIVEVKATGYSGGAFFLALEYCDAGTLRDHLLKRGYSMPLYEATRVAFQILEALDYAHNATIESVKLSDGTTGQAKGLVHRDIKPENIFLCGKAPDWTAKIADFGLSKSFENAGLSGCTRTGDFSGTLGFIPRQQFLNFKYVRPEVDVWSAAATLYYMLTGCPPRDFTGDPFAAILEKAPVPTKERNPSVPDKLAALLDLALDDSGALRFKSAFEFKKALTESLLK